MFFIWATFWLVNSQAVCCGAAVESDSWGDSQWILSTVSQWEVSFGEGLMTSKKEHEKVRLENLAEAVADLAGGDIEELKCNYAPDTFGMHEALDRTAIQMEMWSYILDHPSILLDADLYHQAAKVMDIMHDLYQKIAQKHFLEENKP